MARHAGQGLAIALLAAGAPLAGSARAQDLPASPAPAEAPPADAAPADAAIVITGHYRLASADSGSSGTVAGALLRNMPLLRPAEALETVPGLIVAQHSGDGKANQYFLRGYNLDHGTDFATSLDGVPVNLPSNAHGQGYADLNMLIPELVAQIDYRKGPYFAENGDFSAAGSADIHYLASSNGPLASLTGGSFGYRRALVADSLALPHGATLLLAGEGLRENGPWLTPERLGKTNLLARLSGGGAANGWAVDALHYRAHWQATDQVPLALITSGALSRYGALDPTDGGHAGRDGLSASWHRDHGAAFTEASAYFQHETLQLWSDFTFYELRGALAPNPALPSDQFAQTEDRQFAGGALRQGWRHTLAGRPSTSQIGLQWRHDAIDLALLDTQSRIAFATVSHDLVHETQAGLYARNTTSWAPWLRTVVGVRVDGVWMARRALVVPADTGRAHASLASPKGALIFGPFGTTELFVSAGRGFHSNDARGVIGAIDTTTLGPAVPVPALVKAFGKEVGITSQPLAGLQTALNLWALDSDSELVYNADADIGSTSANGASRRWGVEWNSHYAAGRWWLLDADYAWTHARYRAMNANGAAGNHIPGALSQVARLGVTLHDGTRWSLTAEGRYLGRYPLTQDATLNAPGALVVNLRAAGRLWGRLGVSLDVLNLFNRRYDDVAYAQDYRTAPQAPATTGITVHPGEPRALRLGLRAGF